MFIKSRLGRVITRAVALMTAFSFFITNVPQAGGFSVYKNEDALRTQSIVVSEAGLDVLPIRLSAIRNKLIRHEDVRMRVGSSTLDIEHNRYKKLEQLLDHEDFQDVARMIFYLNRSKKVAFRLAGQLGTMGATMSRHLYEKLTGTEGDLEDGVKSVLVLINALVPEDPSSPPKGLANLWMATLEHEKEHIENPEWDGINAEFKEEVVATARELAFLVNLTQEERSDMIRLVRELWQGAQDVSLIELATKIVQDPDKYIGSDGALSTEAISQVLLFVLKNYGDFKDSYELEFRVRTGAINGSDMKVFIRNRNQERNARFHSEQGYFLREQAANYSLREMIKNGATPADFQVKGELSPPESGYAQKMPSITSEKYTRLKARGEELLKAGAVASGFSAGGMSKRSGGIIVADHQIIIEGIDKHPRSFLAWKIGIIRSSMKKYGTKIPIIILTSSVSHDTIKNILKENEYFGLDEKDIILVNQGLTKYIIPSVNYLNEYLDAEMERKGGPSARALAKGIKYEEGYPGRPLILGDGNVAVCPPGHFGFIKCAIIDGVLAQLKRNGVKYILHANMNNLPGSIIDPAIVANFDKACEDAKKDKKPLPVMLVELAENRGELGGFPAEVKEPGQKPYIRVIERASWPKDMPARRFPHFNTANYIFSVDALLGLYGLSDDYDKEPDFKTENFIERLDHAVDIPYVPSDEIVDASVGDAEYLVYRIEQFLSDLTTVSGKENRVLWLEVERDKRFIPTKLPHDLDMYGEALHYVLEGNVSLPEPVPVDHILTYSKKASTTKSSSSGSELYNGFASAVRNPKIKHGDALEQISSSALPVNDSRYGLFRAMLGREDFKAVGEAIDNLRIKKNVEFIFAENFGTLAVTVPKNRFEELTGQKVGDEIDIVVILNTILLPSDPRSPPEGLADLWEATIEHEKEHVDNPRWGGEKAEFLEEVLATLGELRILVNKGEFARENIKNLILADWFQSLSIELIKLADEIERHGDIYIDRNGTFTV
ncbi:MAG: hypothetical protein ABH843_05705, partial [Candidatus Omnitrophota bacterium]